jgi:hypothetical protein
MGKRNAADVESAARGIEPPRRWTTQSFSRLHGLPEVRERRRVHEP